MAVEADHLLHQVVAEAVHHRHDDDQRRDAEHDAEEGEAGDHRDRLLRVAGAQIAERDHPFERRERARRTRRRGGVDGGGGHARQPLTAGHLLPQAGEGARSLLPLAGEGGRRSRPDEGTCTHHAFPPSLSIAASTLTSSRSPVRRSSPRPCRRRGSWGRRSPDAAGRSGPWWRISRPAARRGRRRGRRRRPPPAPDGCGWQAPSVAASPTLRLMRPTANGATASGQIMPASSWFASISAAASRLGPMP